TEAGAAAEFSATAGVGERAAGICAGAGGRWVALYPHQPARPMTQRVIAIQAWRSIRAAREAIHKQDDLKVGAPKPSGTRAGHRGLSHFAAARDHALGHPRDDNDRAGASRGPFHEKHHASLPLRGNKPNKSARNGSRNPARPEMTTRAKSATDNRE